MQIANSHTHQISGEMAHINSAFIMQNTITQDEFIKEPNKAWDGEKNSNSNDNQSKVEETPKYSNCWTNFQSRQRTLEDGVLMADLIDKLKDVLHNPNPKADKTENCNCEECNQVRKRVEEADDSVFFFFFSIRNE